MIPDRHSSEVLARFHPLIAQWFSRRIGAPTRLQETAWPLIAQGRHVLVTGPTGSGKTLAAFLWAVNQLALGRLQSGAARVLYVSPLRALNNDVARNLIGPLQELGEVFQASGEPFPDIRVRTRSGDTPASDRRRMLRRPPEILITTPESLNLLLSSIGGRSILTSLSTVILDEIHAVAGTKRGVHLMTAVERLVLLSGEFQRIALSATVNPLETVARFVGGLVPNPSASTTGGAPRPVAVASSPSEKKYAIRIHRPEPVVEREEVDAWWEVLAREFKKELGPDRSTLFFVNSRRLAEKLTLKINQGEPGPLAHAHHGSLSREVRETVEARLKAGTLQAIVATNSLELGIDVGAVDEVVLVQSPPSISSGVQRVGRAGHQVGAVSRAGIYPTHSQDFLEAAVLARAMVDQDIEPLRPVENPLDVLAQVLVSMAGTETWELDRMFQVIRSCYSFRNLSRKAFDLVVNMLDGRFSGTRIRELAPRLSVDRIEETVAARKGALLALYTSGGTIPDRGYFRLRRQDSDAVIGDLDEEFVWEARIGQTFTLGAQSWRIQGITHNDVLVLPGQPQAGAPPFWRAEDQGRDFYFSERIGCFLEEADPVLATPGFKNRLVRDYFMEPKAADELIDFLVRQKEACRCPLPGRRHLVVEHTAAGPGGVPGHQIIWHTMWGGRVNRPLALALAAGWEERFGERLEVFAGNDCLAILLPREVPGREIVSLVNPGNLESLLKKRLEGSGIFGARFRECAGRALLLSKRKFGERLPLWMSRLRSQKLLAAVRQFEDFPILLETWRTCLQDEFDLDSLTMLLGELESGLIAWSETVTGRPSPLARNITWRQINDYMYQGDEPDLKASSRLRDDLLREILFSPNLRPAVGPELVEEFRKKRQRLLPGYAPSEPRDLVDWVKERLWIPEEEWSELMEALERDREGGSEKVLGPASSKLVRIRMGDERKGGWIAALEQAQGLVWTVLGENPGMVFEALSGPGPVALPAGIGLDEEEGDRDEALTGFLGEWLSCHGPLSLEEMIRKTGLQSGPLTLALEDLAEIGRIVTGRLIQGLDQDLICDAANFEILLRLNRARARPSFEPRLARDLALFLALHQGLVEPGDGPEAVYDRILSLLGLDAPAGLWETEILPARLAGYQTSWADEVLDASDLIWVGRGKERILFCFESDLDLVFDQDLGHREPASSGGPEEDEGALVRSLFPDPEARYDFSTLVRTSGLSPSDLSEKIWAGVWQGLVTNDAFSALRQGLDIGFKPPRSTFEPRNTAKGRRPGYRAALAGWKAARPFPGTWRLVPDRQRNLDPMETEERKKDRVRLLLDRYGLLARELLIREISPFTWAELFKTLRLMELSGELLAGQFFQGLGGPQFLSPAVFQALRHAFPKHRIFWLNAADPASLCGPGPEAIRKGLPRRLPSNHLVYRGNRVVLISEKNGRHLTFLVPPDDPDLSRFLTPLVNLLTRRVKPLRRISMETINDVPADQSPYLQVFSGVFDVLVEFRRVVLYQGPGGGGEK